MSCWHKLFCKRESVSNSVSVFLLIQIITLHTRDGLATERIQYCKGNSLISLDNKLMFYQVLYFYFCWLISEFVVQAGNSEVTEV